MASREFEHYHGCRFKDPDNCSGCALTTGGEDGPNYAAWPLAYIENHRAIPAKWRNALQRELERTDNTAYVANINEQIRVHGLRFTDGKAAA